MKKEKNKKRKLKKGVYILILIIMSVALCFTLFRFISLFIDQRKTSDLASDLDKQIKKNIPIEKDALASEDTSQKEKVVYTRDFDELEKINQDTVAWIEVEKTNINYPVVQTKNNSYYLIHSFDKSKNGNGWIFLNNANNADFSDQNTIIFAHSSLFRPLWSLYKGKYGNNIKITIYQRNQVLTYKVFAVYLIEPNNTKIIDRKLDNNVLKQAKESSKVNFNVDANENDSILTLSTCYTDSTQRVIVQAKQV